MNKIVQIQRMEAWLQKSPARRKVLACLDWYMAKRAQHLSRYHTESQSAYRIKSWLVATVIVLIGLAALAGAAKVGQHHYRHHAEKRSLEQTRLFLERGDYRNAALSAQQTLILNPKNLSACRVQAELAERNHSPLTLSWLQQIAQIEPTVENKLILASAGLRYQPAPFPLAVQIMAELAPTATNRASYHVVAASLAMHTSRLAEAKSHFEAALASEPGNQLFRTSVAVLKMTLTNQMEQSQSRAILDQMQTDDHVGLMVLRALVTDRLLRGDWPAAKIYSDKLATNPQATVTDRVQNLGILKQLKSNELNPRLQVVQRQAATNAVAVAELSAWMQANGLLSENLNWLTDLPNSLLDQVPVQMALAQGYFQNQKWMPMLKVAMPGNWGNLEYLRLAMISKAWSQLGGTGLAESNWDQAVSLAARNRETMFQLMHLVESWQLPEQRRFLLLQIVQKFPEERWAERELELLYFNSGDTLGLHQLYTLLNKRFPAEIAYQNNLAASALLLNIEVAESRQWAADACAKDPDNSIVATTYAFALHLQGRDKQGLAVLQKLPPAELSKPSVAIYYGALLAAVGKTDQAKPWLDIAQTQGHLLPEEKLLLASAQALD